MSRRTDLFHAAAKIEKTNFALLGCLADAIEMNLPEIQDKLREASSLLAAANNLLEKAVFACAASVKQAAE